MGPLTKFRASLKYALPTNTHSEGESGPAKPRRPTRLKILRWGKSRKHDDVESDIVLPDNRSIAKEAPNEGIKREHTAVENLPIARELQNLGYNITPSRLDRKAIILAAASNGWSHILEYFLAPERRVDVPDLQNTLNTALYNATKRVYVAVVRILLQSGADPNSRGQFERTALHNAAKRGHGEIVRLLLEKGARIRVVDHDGKTPLHLAGDEGNEEVFLMMHMHLHGNLSHVRREGDDRRRFFPNLPSVPQFRLGAYEYPLPGGPADPRPAGRNPVFYHPHAERL